MSSAVVDRKATTDAFDLGRRIFEAIVSLDHRSAQAVIRTARNAGVEAVANYHMQRLFDVGSAWAIDRIALERRLLRTELKGNSTEVPGRGKPRTARFQQTIA